MRQLAGKDIELASATESNGTWFIYPEGGAQSGHIVINGKTGQATSARSELSYAELSATTNVQFANGMQTYASVAYDPGAVDANVHQAAARAVKDFCGRAFQARQISRTQGEGRDVWRFESEATSKGSISVTIGCL